MDRVLGDNNTHVKHSNSLHQILYCGFILWTEKKLTLSNRVNKISISPTIKVFSKTKEMIAQGIDVINLSVGEPDFPTPTNIKEAAKRALDNNFTRYTLNNGTVELRTAIANKLKTQNGLDYSPDNIIVSTGAKQSLYNAVQSLISDNDEAVIPAPYYVSYTDMVILAHGRSVILPTDEQTQFIITSEQLEKAITSQTKVLILSYPTNPTGSNYSRKELEAIAEVVEKNNLFVVCDDIYENFIYDNNEFVTFASINKSMKERTVVVNGFSKSYSMTGWRIGYAAGPEEIIKAMGKIQSHSTSNASSISQAAAVEALKGPQNSVHEMQKEFEIRRNFIYGQFCSIPGITCFKPKGAFYIFPNIKNYLSRSTNNYKIENSLDLSMYLLNEAKVSTVPGSAFGAEGYIRISFASSMESIKEGAVRIKEALKKLN
jgi:aspartate aminotransferase